MYSQKIMLVGLAIVAFQIISTEAIKIPKCKGMDIKVTEEQIIDAKECMKTVGIENMKMTPKQMNCLAKCAVEKNGLIDTEGKPHKEKILVITGDAMPEIVKAEFQTAMEHCLDNFSEKADPADENCTSYGYLAICVHKSFMEICKVNPEDIKA